MKFIKTMMIAAGTASVALAPIAATAAAPVVPISAAARSAPTSVDDSDLRGKNSSVGIIIALLAAALIIVGIVIAADSNDDNPVSP